MTQSPSSDRPRASEANDILYHLEEGLLLFSRGMIFEARQSWRRILLMDPSNDAAQDYIESSESELNPYDRQREGEILKMATQQVTGRMENWDDDSYEVVAAGPAEEEDLEEDGESTGFLLTEEEQEADNRVTVFDGMAPPVIETTGWIPVGEEDPWEEEEEWEGEQGFQPVEMVEAAEGDDETRESLNDFEEVLPTEEYSGESEDAEEPVEAVGSDDPEDLQGEEDAGTVSPAELLGLEEGLDASEVGTSPGDGDTASEDPAEEGSIGDSPVSAESALPESPSEFALLESAVEEDPSAKVLTPRGIPESPTRGALPPRAPRPSATSSRERRAPELTDQWEPLDWMNEDTPSHGLRGPIPESLGITLADETPEPALPPGPDQYLMEARRQASAGQLETALEILRDVVRQHPSHIQAQIQKQRLEQELLLHFETILGRGDGIPVLRLPPLELMSLKLDKIGGYILSLVDGILTLEDIYMLSSHVEKLIVMGILAGMVRNNVISIRR